MKLLSTQQAAFLYLLLFNIGEAGDQKHDNLEQRAKDLLTSNFYEPEPIYDNEGSPCIKFPDNFDYDTWVQEYLEPHDWVHPDLSNLLDNPNQDLFAFLETKNLGSEAKPDGVDLHPGNMGDESSAPC